MSGLPLRILSAPCDECLFSPERIVSPRRMRQVLRACRRKDTGFCCHKATIAGCDVICHAFYETQPPWGKLTLARQLDDACQGRGWPPSVQFVDEADLDRLR